VLLQTGRTRHLAPNLVAVDHSSLADALHTVFVWSVPLAAVALVAAILLKELSLSARRTPTESRG
jgi:hypothetical protein